PSIRVVVLASLGPFYFSDRNFAADHRGAFDAANWVLEPAGGSATAPKPTLFEEGLSRTIERLQQAGKEVVLFIDVPELDFRPETCVDARPFRIVGARVRTPCSVPRPQVNARQASYRAMI